ncbi:U6 snRNA-associated Sm-like protein LSm8 [Plasmodium brasilianum]|uniref:U6 snRNA-associated Sm-like protein LSm8 n=2 Tax=Plasmodium (Plasmodium) TaxID=418103 RepID=A0A1A8X1D0_PLAMA|nr:U6 snRNA-associated Sm-like protein LSm8, putative [Plasmodium malariae]KAI4839936.1 U6 snRNA-associated Sm-like protein LSm8 [Plasmodium brasilianum]SBS99061.1 U6 snRNA-associated Sm-like protein LSm8 [Plasmodium malariae]SBT74833.1 U6 snRNA-associated Sm-like protein LSm8, putative [Plasmodium malariae]SBT87305.1 U6 snRNA-associated Sm-like protein LSm8, putative [Plasmodium malariae]
MTSINIESYLENEILVITNDSRIFTGKLKGFDQTTNIILGNCYERIYKESLEKISLGLYIIRGDTVTLIGEIDEDVDKNILHNKIKPEMLKQVIGYKKEETQDILLI